MKFEVREVTISDIPFVEQVEKSSFTDPYPMSLLMALAISDPSTFLVATLNGSVVGYASAIVGGGGSAHMVSVAVDPEHRGQGVAKQLIESLLAVLKRRGVTHVQLEVRESNLAAQTLYKSLGFKYRDRVKNYYEDGEDAFTMTLHL
ncbi:MAG: ribosomal protein S18-alanine N-acetyltransferase [Candidatus Bathyarchaeia archaeon]